jgi:hypothetical protein
MLTTFNNTVLCSDLLKLALQTNQDVPCNLKNLDFLNSNAKKEIWFYRDLVEDLEFNYLKSIQVTGPIFFDVIIYDMKCSYYKYIYNYSKDRRYQNDTQKKSKMEKKSVAQNYFGIKIVDLLRLYNFTNTDTDFRDIAGIFKEILKIKNSNEKNEIFGYTSYNLIKFIDSKTNSKLDYNIRNFANGVIVFESLNDLNNLPPIEPRENSQRNYDRRFILQKDKECIYINTINCLIDKITKSVIQELIDGYYLQAYNYNIDCEEEKCIIFDEPRSLFDIMDEFYHGECTNEIIKKSYNKLKRVIKHNDLPPIVLESTYDITDKNKRHIKLEYMDNLFFKTWTKGDFELIHELIKEKFADKTNKNKRTKWDNAYKQSNYGCYFGNYVFDGKGNKKEQMRRCIKYNLDEFNAQK